MATGLNDFLKHIRSNPQNDVLIDRFTALVGELDAKSRQPYFEKLFLTLEKGNPHGALRVAYFNLQSARSQASGTVLEIEALQWIEKAFVLLGKSDHASLVKQEWEHLKKNQLPPVPATDRKKKKTLVETPKEKSGKSASAKSQISKTKEATVSEQRFTTQRANFIASLYESYARQVLDALQTQLLTFKGTPQSEAAAAHLIKSFRHVYAEMKSTLRNSLAVFGHNPLLVTEEDKFREELVDVFLKTPLFLQGKDRISSQRVRVVASLLIAWFDQQQNLPPGLLPLEQERVHHKLLEIAIAAALRFED